MDDNRIYFFLGVGAVLSVVFGSFNLQPQIIKVLTGGSLIITICFLAYCFREVNNNVLYLTLNVLLIYALFQIGRCILNPTEVGFTTFIFSPFNVFCCCLPFFVVLVDNDDFLKQTIILALICSVLSVLFINAIGLAPALLFLFFPFIKENLTFLLIFLCSCLLDVLFGLGFFVENSNRSFLLEIAVLSVMWIVVWKMKDIRLIKISIFILILLPVLLLLSIVIFEDSIFSMLGLLISNEEMSGDTRTFLYLEIFQNMESWTDWFLGLGYNAKFFSDYFFNSPDPDGDFYWRSNVEVYFLQLLLKGGIILVILHYSIIIYAIINCLRNSTNTFCYACAMYLAVFILLSFIIDYPSRIPMAQIIPWLCVGICCSEKWLNMPDVSVVNENINEQ